MRTKALLAAAAISAVAISAMAQSNVYSLNVVGYVNVGLNANKFAMVENSLNASGGNIITNVLSGTYPDQTTLTKFVGGNYLDPETYYAGFGWFPGTNIINPGDGFFIKAGTATTLTFVGEVVQGSASVTLSKGFSMVGSPVAQSLPLGDSASSPLTTYAIPAADQDTVYRFFTNSFSQPITYYAGYGWIDPNAADSLGPTNGPSMNVGEAFFYSTAAGKTWTRSFTVQ